MKRFTLALFVKKVDVNSSVIKERVAMKKTITLLILSGTLFFFSPDQFLAKKVKCPDEYQRMPLAKAAALLKDYAGCKVEVEVQYMFTMDQEMAKMYRTDLPRKYKNYVLFMVTDDASGTAVAAILKEKSDPVFELTQGDRILVKGIIDPSASKPGTWNEFRFELSTDAFDIRREWAATRETSR